MIVPFLKKRARCILWVKEVLTVSKGSVERRHKYRRVSRGRMKKRRVLIVVEERYIVVLEERKEEKVLEFITAIPADESCLAKIRRESALMETKKPLSYPLPSVKIDDHSVPSCRVFRFGQAIEQAVHRDR